MPLFSMGKNRKRKKKQYIPKGKILDPSRRNFLKYGLAGLAVASIPGVYLANRFLSQNDPHQAKEAPAPENPWDFLKEVPDYYGETYHGPREEIFLERYVKIGLSLERGSGSLSERDLKEFRHNVIQELNARGMTDKYTMGIFYQIYGVPAQKKHAEPLLEYCKKAVDFLQQKIPSFKIPEFEWVPIKNHDNFSMDFSQKCFIGHSFYRTWTPVVEDKQGRKTLLPEIAAYQNSDGGLNSHPHRKKPDEWYLFITTGPDALVTPYSETIPLITFETDSKTFKTKKDMRLAGETISEGISHVVAKEFIDEMQIPDGERTVDWMLQKSLKNHHEVYKHVPASIRWIQAQGKNGPQKALELYMDSPIKFMEAIKNA